MYDISEIDEIHQVKLIFRNFHTFGEPWIYSDLF